MKQYIILVLLFFSTVLSVNGQNRELLQKDKQRLENEIRVANDLLSKTRSDKKQTLSQLSILENKIKSREALIENLNSETRLIDRKIALLADSIAVLNTRLTDLKAAYEEMILHAWETRSSYERMMYIFSADDFNQAYKRMQYYSKYSEARREQAAAIERTRLELLEVKLVQEQRKLEQLGLIKRKETEKTVLNGEKTSRHNTITLLQKKEKDLKKQISQNEQAARKLEQEIERIIREEMAKANKGTSTKSFQLTPEELMISGDFEKNKGKLLWPTERGILSSSYGEHAHPVLKGVKIKNNGIDILTDKGAVARAIFEGTVSRIIKVPQYNNVIIIRHGAYLTVYSNLDKVFVSEGSKVEARTSLGTVFTDPETGNTAIHLEVWKGSAIQNPQSWLAR